MKYNNFRPKCLENQIVIRRGAYLAGGYKRPSRVRILAADISRGWNKFLTFLGV